MLKQKFYRGLVFVKLIAGKDEKQENNNKISDHSFKSNSCVRNLGLTVFSLDFLVSLQ